MPKVEEQSKEAKVLVDRIIGKYSSGKEGSLLLVTAGVHGNEPSGVIALKKIFKKLEDTKPEIAGTFLALAGNVQALNQDQRYIDKDMNRIWPENRSADFVPENHEEKEMKDIWETLDRQGVYEYDERYYLDCHTTSSESVPYISVQEIGKNDEWAHQFPLYIVRGFSDLIVGSIDNHFSRNGFTSFAFEGGAHFGENTIQNQEGMIWLTLSKANKLPLEEIKGIEGCIEGLTPEDGSKTFEILYRHNLKEGDTFKMQPGYKNFQPIKKGEYLADHNGEKILSQWNARIFMPLYQAKGNDGFFVIEEVKSEEK